MVGVPVCVCMCVCVDLLKAMARARNTLKRFTAFDVLLCFCCIFMSAIAHRTVHSVKWKSNYTN